MMAAVRFRFLLKPRNVKFCGDNECKRNELIDASRSDMYCAPLNAGNNSILFSFSQFLLSFHLFFPMIILNY